jgi:hypothetical protein
MTLLECAEASGWNPQSYVLSCFDFDMARENQADLHGIAGTSDVSSTETHAHSLISVEDVKRLQNEH